MNSILEILFTNFASAVDLEEYEVFNNRGTLEGNDAENFLDDVLNVISDYQHLLYENTRKYVNELEERSKELDVSEKVFASLTQEVESLKEKVKNKELTLERIENCLSNINKTILA